MPRQAPFHDAIGEPDRPPPACPQQAHRLVGEHAVGAAAVRHHVGVGGQLAQATGELVDRDVHRAGQVTGRVFHGRSHVEHDDAAGGEAPQQFLPVDRLDSAVGLQVGVAGRRRVGQMRLGPFVNPPL